MLSKQTLLATLATVLALSTDSVVAASTGSNDRVVEIVGGLIKGLVGEDRRAQIKECLADPEVLEIEILRAVDDFQTINVKQVVEGIQ